MNLAEAEKALRAATEVIDNVIKDAKQRGLTKEQAFEAVREALSSNPDLPEVALMVQTKQWIEEATRDGSIEEPSGYDRWLEWLISGQKP
jgi:hypothetical protein